MAKYKVTEFFPQATVRLVRVVEADSQEEAYEFGHEYEPLEPEFLDINYGGEAITESVELVKE